MNYMKKALKQAKKAAKILEVPIGAIIVRNGKIISKAYNLRESKNSATAHAEILAINRACKKLKSWRLNDCEIYVTLEPCVMCAGAIITSRIKKVYIGALDPKGGAVCSGLKLFDNKVPYETGIMGDECGLMLTEFFRKLRRKIV